MKQVEIDHEANRLEAEAEYPRRKRRYYIQKFVWLAIGVGILILLKTLDVGLLGNEAVNLGLTIVTATFIVMTFAIIVVERWTEGHVTIGDVGSVYSPEKCERCDKPMKFTPYSKFRVVAECDGESFTAVGYCGKCTDTGSEND